MSIASIDDSCSSNNFTLFFKSSNFRLDIASTCTQHETLGLRLWCGVNMRSLKKLLYLAKLYSFHNTQSYMDSSCAKNNHKVYLYGTRDDGWVWTKNPYKAMCHITNVKVSNMLAMYMCVSN